MASNRTQISATPSLNINRMADADVVSWMPESSELIVANRCDPAVLSMAVKRTAAKRAANAF